MRFYRQYIAVIHLFGFNLPIAVMGNLAWLELAPAIRYPKELAQYPLRGLDLRPLAAAPQVAQF